MSMAPKPGSHKRNYPPRRLSAALQVARAIQDQASGMPVSRLTLAEILKTTPGSSVFGKLVASSRFYGLTTGGINATEFALTTVGKDATGENAERRVAALKAAVLNVPPYKAFFEHFVDKKVPGDPAFAEFLRKYASVPSDRVEECMEHIVADAETAGLLRSMSGGKWVDMTGIPAATSEEQGDQPDDGDDGETGAVERATSTEGEGIPAPVASESETPATSKRPNAIFVGHGRNKKPRDQLVKILTEYGIPHKVAEDEPNRGRPIPTKVKETMEECGAAILIFSADEELFDKNGQSLWRPSENVVHELGAASVMYDNRIVVFREEGVDLATNYESIGYITFEKDDIPARANDLFRELIAFGILKVSVNAD